MKFKLDYNVWICGRPLDNKHSKNNYLGVGHTELLNCQGYQCCLGQFCEQLGISKELLFRRMNPASVYGLSGGKSITFVKLDGLNRAYCNLLAISAIEINDNMDTTISQKVIALQKLFKEHGHEIELVNFPFLILPTHFR